MFDSEFYEHVGDVLTTTIFEFAGRPISLATGLIIAAVMAGTLALSWLTRRAIRKAYEHRQISDEGNVGVVMRLVHYAFLLVGFGVAVEAVGLDLSALFTAGAVFAVALGFAIQNIVQSFVSGVILLSERTIKPGDVLEVEGKIVKVRHMGIRATVVRTLNDEDIIVPNNVLVQGSVKNFTLRDANYRLRAAVGVVYSSDMELVRETLEKAAAPLPWRLKAREPVVLLTDFGDSSVNFEVSVWIDDPWAYRRRRSELNFAIWNALKAEGLVIAFPQVDVHFDPPVATGLAGLASPPPEA